MSIEVELAALYQKHGFGEQLGRGPRTVGVYTGCMLVPLPNIETRRRFLKYHDLHHLVTGYSVERIGEGEISAWELGTGSAFVSPMLGIMNLIALSTGLFPERKRMWRAFKRGCASRNLYAADVREAVDAGRWLDVAALRSEVLEVRASSGSTAVRALEFGMYSGLALGIHACLAIPAVIARFFSDTLFGGGIFQAVKPRRRTDLY